MPLRHEVLSHEQWIKARKDLLTKEKDLVPKGHNEGGRPGQPRPRTPLSGVEESRLGA